MLYEKVEDLYKEAKKAFEEARTSKDLYSVKVKYLGRTGVLSVLMKEMKNLSSQERPKFGQVINKAKQDLEALFLKFQKQLNAKEMDVQLQNEVLDLTLPGTVKYKGARHPVSLVLEEAVKIFEKIGYSVRLGPLIESDYYNFAALNIPENHPARDMQDTFYITKEYELRTHTSPIQIRSLENEKPPLRILGPGAVFRCDYDQTHLPMFHQLEGMLIDKKVSMADLKGTLSYFNREFFGPSFKTQFRPSFFPFTEPSAEVDASKDGKTWLEMAGCGLVHPHVLQSVGLDPEEWQGFAFGMGIERLASVKFGVRDMRLFIENDVRFLEQFS